MGIESLEEILAEKVKDLESDIMSNLWYFYDKYISDEFILDAPSLMASIKYIKETINEEMSENLSDKQSKTIKELLDRIRTCISSDSDTSQEKAFAELSDRIKAIEVKLLHATISYAYLEHYLSIKDYSKSLSCLVIAEKDLFHSQILAHDHIKKLIKPDIEIDIRKDIASQGGLARGKQLEPKKARAIHLFETGQYSSYDSCANAIFEELGVKSPRTVSTWLSKHYKEKSFRKSQVKKD